MSTVHVVAAFFQNDPEKGEENSADVVSKKVNQVRTTLKGLQFEQRSACLSWRIISISIVVKLLSKRVQSSTEKECVDTYTRIRYSFRDPVLCHNTQQKRLRISREKGVNFVSQNKRFVL